MAKSFDDRRSGRDRRAAGGRAAGKERRSADRRQFPPAADPGSVSEASRRLQQSIDAYKKERGIARLSVDELLRLLEQLGYRVA